MRTLTHSEKRTVRFALVGLSIYLVLFGGFHAGKYLEGKRAEYRKLVEEANTLKQRVKPYQEKAEVVRTLMETFHLDPAKLSKSSIVGEASAELAELRDV